MRQKGRNVGRCVSTFTTTIWETRFSLSLLPSLSIARPPPLGSEIARQHRDANFVNILALGLHSAGVSRFREACHRRRRCRSTRLNATDPQRLSPVVSLGVRWSTRRSRRAKTPRLGYRNRVFASAQATAASDEYRVELGWVVVAKSHQGQRLSTRIVGELLTFAKNENVFATTRADKRAMRFAPHHGFKIDGKPFPSGRGYDLVLYLCNAARLPDAKSPPQDKSLQQAVEPTPR